MNDHHNFDEIAARLIASLPDELHAPAAPAQSRAQYLADRAELLRAGGFPAVAIDAVRADGMRDVPAMSHAVRYRAQTPGVPPTVLVLLGGTDASFAPVTIALVVGVPWLAGIAISIGVLVDGAIVEVENAYRKIHLWEVKDRKSVV